MVLQTLMAAAVMSLLAGMIAGLTLYQCALSLPSKIAASLTTGQSWSAWTLTAAAAMSLLACIIAAEQCTSVR
jgi:hypothetical protein